MTDDLKELPPLKPGLPDSQVPGGFSGEAVVRQRKETFKDKVIIYDQYGRSYIATATASDHKHGMEVVYAIQVGPGVHNEHVVNGWGFVHVLYNMRDNGQTIAVKAPGVPNRFLVRGVDIQTHQLSVKWGAIGELFHYEPRNDNEEAGSDGSGPSSPGSH